MTQKKRTRAACARERRLASDGGMGGCYEESVIVKESGFVDSRARPEFWGD